VQAELGAEVRHPLAGRKAVVGRRLPVIGIVGGERRVVGAEKLRVAHGAVEAVLSDVEQERLRAVVDFGPQRRVEAREQAARGAVPAVPEVAGQFFKAADARGKLGTDVESVGGSAHGLQRSSGAV
jgi:hypothetical protein